MKKKLISDGKNVDDDTNIIQYFKWRVYNHKTAECRNQDICYNCHGENR